MVFQIAHSEIGTRYDITKYIASGGIKWSRNDVEAAGAGRTQEGLMERDRVAIKYRFDVTCRPLTAVEQSTLLQLIEPTFVYLVFTDPTTNITTGDWFYSNNIPSTYMIKQADGTEWWTGLAFPLIQK